jgi:AraC family transcriptional activator of pyochelin receptor
VKKVASLRDRTVMVSRHLGGRLTLAAGSINFGGWERPDEAIRPGLKLVVVLSGASTIRLGKGPPVRLGAPATLVLHNETAVEREQVFATGATYRYALIDVDPSLVSDEIGIELRKLCPPDEDGVWFVVRRATTTERALASQILASPIGQEHNLTRLAKALDMAGTILGGLRSPSSVRVQGRLSSSEIERIHEARSLLLRSLVDPPDQATLASATGLNPRRLGIGFRALFGTTPYALLQEERLQDAYKRLAASASSVSEVAYAVGYSPAHLATLFSRRFGIPPSSLLAGRTVQREDPRPPFETP